MFDPGFPLFWSYETVNKEEVLVDPCLIPDPSLIDCLILAKDSSVPSKSPFPSTVGLGDDEWDNQLML